MSAALSNTYIGEVRGDISSEYAAQIYGELARLPEVAEQIVSDTVLIAEIKRMADELVGGNFDFIYTGYLDGVPEEQAHKAAEMIQEMFAGWHFFQFQHGKYDYLIEYEGLGTFYDVEPVHPPKIAKAKKGWL